MHVCPRCETTLSQSEVSEGYEMVQDLSVVAKFKLKSEQKIGNDIVIDDYTYILAWTTTPWTLIGNVALAINKDIKYQLVEADKKYIVAKDRVDSVFDGKDYDVVEEFKGDKLLNLEYDALFDYYSNSSLENHENGWKVYYGDFVNINEGTGVVHIAPAFGEDDMKLGKKNKLPFIQHVSLSGVFNDEVIDFKGIHVKPLKKEERLSTDIEIIKYLAKIGKLFSKAKYEHSYPHCWRCDTPLLNYASSSWFVNVSKIKKRMLELACDIKWSPEHLKSGRFGNWLEGARDWSISRQRYWASVMPLWVCECGEQKVMGSIKELEEVSDKKVNDLHKHVVDKIFLNCKKCKGKMKRVPDVLDTWFDSGSMPYAQAHYPFGNKKQFDENFPAQFIGEGVDQTRCWFYYLHVISTAVNDSAAFENVIANGIVLAENGKKMSKRLENYPDPTEMINKYGADSIRYYLLTSQVMLADQLCFKESELSEVFRNVIMMLNNVLKFYFIFDDGLDHYIMHNESKSNNILDKWIRVKFSLLIKSVTGGMDNYNLPRATRPIENFINDLSTWYVRRSRDRFKSDDLVDKKNELNTLAYVLVEFSKVMAPFMPFIAEDIWQRVTRNNYRTKEKSVHLQNWPILEVEINKSDLSIDANMKNVRKIVELGLSARDKASIKVRQPLEQISINNIEISEEYLILVKDELNVKEVILNKGKGEISIELDTIITQELRLEGLKRDIVRFINSMRKQASLTINDMTIMYYYTNSILLKEVIDRYKDSILKDTLSAQILDYQFKKEENLNIEKELEIGGNILKIGIIKK